MATDEGVDKVLIALNSTGRWQMVMLFLGLIGSIPAALQLLGNVFICERLDVSIVDCV